MRERPQKDFAASAGQKTPREKEPSGRHSSAGEFPSRRGEIVAINTIIKLDFIGIIIIIHTIISTSTIITTPSHCNNRVEYLLSSLGETFPVLITIIVDACEWNHWIIVYVQILIHYHIIFDLDLYDVS